MRDKVDLSPIRSSEEFRRSFLDRVLTGVECLSHPEADDQFC